MAGWTIQALYANAQIKIQFSLARKKSLKSSQEVMFIDLMIQDKPQQNYNSQLNHLESWYLKMKKFELLFVNLNLIKFNYYYSLVERRYCLRLFLTNHNNTTYIFKSDLTNQLLLLCLLCVLLAVKLDLYTYKSFMLTS